MTNKIEIPVGELTHVDIKDIIATENIRTDLSLTDKDKNTNLVDSVRQHGVVEPVILRKDPEGKLHLRAGYRRYNAAKEAGLKQIPANIFTVDESKGLELALIENLQRVDMNPLDRAMAFKDLIEKAGIEQQEAAKRLGISPGYISQHLAILELPTGVQKMVKSGKLEFTAARHLTRLKEPKLIEEMVEKGLDGMAAAEVDEKVRSLLHREEERAKKAREAARAKARDEAKASGKPTPKDAEETDEPPTLVEQYKQAKLKPRSEKSLRALLMEYGEKFENARSDERKKEYELILKGLELAAGVEVTS